jgi:enoyl-CoA hydratase
LVAGSTVTYRREGPVAVVTIARPEVRNAVDPSTADALEAAFFRFEGDQEARVLVLQGEGEAAFCAGADLRAVAAASFADRFAKAGGPLGITHFEAQKPTIAAICGYCVAGGLELALWCDLRIAAEGSLFGCTERRFGVPLVDGGTQRLPRLIGESRALELILTGRLIEAREALAWGLVNEVVPAGSHLRRALELGHQIAAFPQETLLADRRLARRALSLPLSEGLALERQNAAHLADTASKGARRFAAGEGRGGAGVERPQQGS